MNDLCIHLAQPVVHTLKAASAARPGPVVHQPVHRDTVPDLLDGLRVRRRRRHDVHSTTFGGERRSETPTKSDPPFRSGGNVPKQIATRETVIRLR